MMVRTFSGRRGVLSQLRLKIHECLFKKLFKWRSHRCAHRSHRRLYCLVSMTVPDSDPVQLTVANVPVMTVPLTVAFMVYEQGPRRHGG